MGDAARKAAAIRRIAKPRTTANSTHRNIPRRINLTPRFSCDLGDRIGEDLIVIGHLSAGKATELYQVWSVSQICAFTCKIVLPGFSNNSMEMRGFRRETLLLRKTSHPRIVRLFREGVYESRRYLLQEYLQGPSLFELIDCSPGRKLPVPDAVKSLIHIGAAVDHLHSLGYIHRDLKPANMILHRGLPILIDFEVAYRLREGGKPRRAIGTDPYMAPEQCMRLELSPASDVYGLGAVLYETLTGRWPFEKELEKRTEVNNIEERFPQVRAKPPESPSKYAVLPDGMDTVVLKCLEFEPGKRFATVRDLVSALAPYLQGSDRMLPESLDLTEGNVALRKSG